METKQNISPNEPDLPVDVRRDMEYGQLTMMIVDPDDDLKYSTDTVFRTLHIAWRVRRFNLAKYGEISIRASRTSGAKTEMEKILNGEAKAQLYIFEFTDCWIVCYIKDILLCLKDPTRHYIKPNKDKKTWACYIKATWLPHLNIPKHKPTVKRIVLD